VRNVFGCKTFFWPTVLIAAGDRFCGHCDRIVCLGLVF
jgi:hypothetical protein